MIYEDVQRESGPLGADNGWSSSEFESYDEQSDNETKPPTRSKVALACTPDVCESSTLFILNGIVSGQVALLSNTWNILLDYFFISCSSSAVVFINV